MSHTSHPMISVVIPTHNRRERLARAIASVYAQTWPNIEIVVVDDASSDDTPAYLQNLALSDPRVKVVRNELAQGGGGARNCGIAEATGDYIAFLDDDDVWVPEKLDVQLSMLLAKPGVSAVSCGFVAEFPFFGKRAVRVVAPLDEQQLLRSNHLGGASMCLTSKAALLAIGGFDPKLRSGQDWDLWLKLYGQGEIVVSDQALVRYIPHTGVRITSNPKSTYSGRRRIYFRYRSKMERATRLSLLCELMYCRRILLAIGSRAKLSGFVQVFKAAIGRNSLRYTYRFAKHLMLG